MKKQYTLGPIAFGLLALIACQFNAMANAADSKNPATIDMGGFWKVWLDPRGGVIETFPFTADQAKPIELPGSLDDTKLGEKTSEADFGGLTRKYKYYGVAWYRRDIEIPADWQHKQVSLFLERVMWKSDLLSLSNVQTFPDCQEPAIEIRYDLKHAPGDTGKVSASYTLVDNDSGEAISQSQEEISLAENTQSEKHVYRFAVSHPVELWSEFDPKMYTLKVGISDGKRQDQVSLAIGFRKVTAGKTKIVINDQPSFMRGNLNNAEFPVAGYPPCDVEAWERIFRIHKDYGMNHVRFHSWCPPEAAFVAADRVGIYLQVETLWIAQWMQIPSRAKTAARPVALGTDPGVNRYIEEELSRIVAAYGNHPSFVFLCVGNELDNGAYDIIQTWLDKLKAKDGDRRLYSLTSSWYFADKDQYKVTGEPTSRFYRSMSEQGFYRDTAPEHVDGAQYPRFIRAKHTDWDYENSHSFAKVPMIVHEIGQNPMYPLWSEIDKYTGNLAPRNLEQFRQTAIENDVFELNKEFSYASGKLAQLLYKMEIEGMFRTPSCAGFELLGMQDFPGQGEALVGWLDDFYDSKGVVSPEEFRQHCDETVVLMRTDKMVFSTDDVLDAKIQVNHFGEADIHDDVYWNITIDKKIVGKGIFSNQTIAQGTLADIGSFQHSWAGLEHASKAILEVGLKNSAVKNTWDLWVYPTQEATVPDADKVLVTSTFDDKTIKALERGGRVLLVANKLGNPASKVKVSFNQLYWSSTWIPGQSIKTLGSYIRNEHPALKDFPTDTFTGLQWDPISEGAMSFHLHEFPQGYQPIVQPIYDFHDSRKVGSVFEIAVGRGKLLVCGYDITDKDSLVAKQLGTSLRSYAASDKFDPKVSVPVALLTKMFTEKNNDKQVIRRWK